MIKNVVEEIAADLGITAAEASALLTDEERAEVGEQDGDTPVKTATQAVTDNAPVKGPILSKEVADQLLQAGKDTAKEIENARSASDSVARSVLLARAEEISTKPEQVVVFLDGFALGLTECGVKDSVVRVRKAEARAVMEAWSKTIADNLTDARKALVEYTGTYHDFITACRNIRGTKPHKVQGPRVKTRLNESEADRVKELLHGMSAGQAADASVVIAAHVSRMPDGDLAMIRLVSNVYLQHLALSKDAGIAKWAGDARDRAMAILEAAEKANPQQPAADHTAHGIIAVPQPAVQQQAAA